MKRYDPNIYRGVHTVKITLQKWEYKGHIIRRVYGNCKGRFVGVVIWQDLKLSTHNLPKL